MLVDLAIAQRALLFYFGLEIEYIQMIIIAVIVIIMIIIE